MSSFLLNDETLSYIVSAAMQWRTSELSGPDMFMQLREVNIAASRMQPESPEGVFMRVAEVNPTWAYKMCTNYQYQCSSNFAYADTGVESIITRTMREAVAHDVTKLSDAPDQIVEGGLVESGIHIMDQWGFNPTWGVREDMFDD